MTYEIVMPNGDRAEADTIDGAILAARTLAQDATLNVVGAARNLQRGALVYRDGKLDIVTTAQARQA
jgi:hypothetical protein